MSKNYDVFRKYKVDKAFREFKKNPYRATLSFIKNNEDFEHMDGAVQRILISAFAFFLFSFEELKTVNDGVVIDGVLIPCIFIYDFIKNSNDNYIEELLIHRQQTTSPGEFWRIINGFNS